MQTPACYATGKAATSYMLSSFKHRKQKWNSKIHLLIIMKTSFLYHLKQTSWQSMHKWRSFTTPSSLLRYQGWNFSKSTSTIRFNFWKKWNSKINLLIIRKTHLLHHLKQTSCQTMHKLRSFQTSKFTLMLSEPKFF